MKSLQIPVQVVFASWRKPQLVLRDVMLGKTAVLGDHALLYPGPFPTRGVTWQHLTDWWTGEYHLPLEDMVSRMLASIPEESPPQRKPFTEYRKYFGYPHFPAIFPETWIRWDGPWKCRNDELCRCRRADFLMILPDHKRVVIELNRVLHYARKEVETVHSNFHKAMPKIYAETVSADRDLRLEGFDTYVFGGWECQEQRASIVVEEFFTRLFQVYDVE